MGSMCCLGLSILSGCCLLADIPMKQFFQASVGALLILLTHQICTKSNNTWDQQQSWYTPEQWHENGNILDKRRQTESWQYTPESQPQWIQIKDRLVTMQAMAPCPIYGNQPDIRTVSWSVSWSVLCSQCQLTCLHDMHSITYMDMLTYTYKNPYIYIYIYIYIYPPTQVWQVVLSPVFQYTFPIYCGS